jgi:hypothetical protein
MENKLVQLKLVVGRTQNILESENQEAIEQQTRPLHTIVDEIEKIKVAEEAKMISEKRDLDEMSKWKASTEGKLTEADNNIRSLCEWCESKKQECDERQRRQELDFEHELFQIKARNNRSTK